MNPPPPSSAPLTISEGVIEYIEYSRKRHKLNTYRQKAHILSELIKFISDNTEDIHIESPVSTLSACHITKYLDHVYDSATIFHKDGSMVPGGKKANRDLREINTWLNYLVRFHELPTNPAKVIEKYKEPIFKKYVPPLSDIQALIECATQDEKDIIQTAYHTLARSGELRRMKVCDCNFEKRMVTLWTGKRAGGKIENDDLEMNNTLYQILKRRCSGLGENDYIFHSKNGGKLGKDTIQGFVERPRLKNLLVFMQSGIM